MKDTIAELKRRTTGVSVPLDKTPSVPLMVKPLGLHNMDLPGIQIPELPELPDKTGPSTSGVATNLEVPKTNTGDYVTSLGRIIPLLENDLEIAQELLQSDPDITEIEQPETMENTPKINTLPCSINLRRLDHQDITKWQVQKAPVALPDATNNTPDTIDSTAAKYNMYKGPSHQQTSK